MKEDKKCCHYQVCRFVAAAHSYGEDCNCELCIYRAHSIVGDDLIEAVKRKRLSSSMRSWNYKEGFNDALLKFCQCFIIFVTQKTKEGEKMTDKRKQDFDDCTRVELTNAIKYRIHMIREIRMARDVLICRFPTVHTMLNVKEKMLKSEIVSLLQMRRVMRRRNLHFWRDVYDT